MRTRVAKYFSLIRSKSKKSIMNNVSKLADQIEREVMDSENYKNYMSEPYTDEDSVLDYTKNSVLDYDEDEKSILGLSSYSVRTLYAGGGGNPVQVELFGTNFNTGVIVGTTLTFTNGVDTVTVTGITSAITAFQDRLRSADFKCAYFQENVVGAAQLQERFRFQKDSVYGGGRFNDLNPQEFITPEQFQLLRVQVPVNSTFTSQRRLIFNVVSSETAPGTFFTFFVNGLVDNARVLQGKRPGLKMTGDGILEAQPTKDSTRQISELAKSQKETQKLIKTLALSSLKRG